MSVPSPLRMSVLGGIWRLRTLCAARPDLTPSEAAQLLARGRAIDAGYDYAGTLEACSHLSFVLHALPDDRVQLLRFVIRLSLLELQPPWGVALPYGRSPTFRLLSEDEQQCFLAAGLLDENPSEDVVRWWDELALARRWDLNASNLETGRRAEQLSMEHERQRLQSAGRPDLNPVLVAIDDNTLGYDIRSFEPDGSPRYIEVKGCSAPPLMFFLSRNEWGAASRLKDQYEVHVWDLSGSKQITIGFRDLSHHIPADQGHGRWHQLKIGVPQGDGGGGANADIF